jgi:dephospho-CoA kinase
MIRAGLTGGLASGKSFVARVLEELGCHVIRADDLGHQVMLPGGEAYDSIVEEFSADILEPDGNIDRRKLAALVFNDPIKLSRLNNLVHPAVFRREEEFVENVRRTDPSGIVVVEAAILVETGRYRWFDRLILAVCTPEQQVERALKRDETSREEVLARLSRQMPLEEKRKFADYVIDTSGPKEQTIEQTRKVYESLRSINLSRSIEL